MKLLTATLTLTMISISAGAFGKDYQWECANMIFKVENPLFGKREIYYRKDGNWINLCNSKESRITNDSFNCVLDSPTVERMLLDEVTKKLRLNFKKNNEVKDYYCFIRKQKPKD